jgi:hypothetical protein
MTEAPRAASPVTSSGLLPVLLHRHPPILQGDRGIVDGDQDFAPGIRVRDGRRNRDA